MPLNYRSLTTLYNAITGDNAPVNESEAIEQFANTVVEKGKVVKEQAKTLVSNAKAEIVENIMPTLRPAIEKAIPTSLAAAATLQFMGSQGSFLDFIRPAYLSSYFINLDADRHTYIGYPLHEIRALSGLSGYCQCANVKLDIPGATVDEIGIITAALEGGVFIE